LKVNIGGQINRVIDLFVDHPVPASSFYTRIFAPALSGTSPNDFTSEVYKITPSGQKRTVAGQDNRALFCGSLEEIRII